MKRLALAASALVALAASAGAQVVPPGTNPVPAAGAYNSSPPALTSGQAGWLQLDSAGNLRVSGTVTSALSGSTSNASSGVATSATNVPTVSYNYGFNGTTWDQLQVDGSKFLKVVLGAETSKVIGTVNQGTSPWVVSGTVSVTQGGSPWIVLNAPSSAAGAALIPVSSAALAANTIIKASAGNLYSFEVAADSTLSAAAWWIMIHNATSAPADGAVTPLKCYAMPLGTTTFSAAFPTPVAFSTGIVIGVSTTGCFTKTASTHAFISGDAQ